MMGYVCPCHVSILLQYLYCTTYSNFDYTTKCSRIYFKVIIRASGLREEEREGCFHSNKPFSSIPTLFFDNER